MPDSTKAKTARKPRPDFPLFPHATGRWAKKVRGKFAFFGSTAADPKGVAALNLWLEQKDDLLLPAFKWTNNLVLKCTGPDV